MEFNISSLQSYLEETIIIVGVHPAFTQVPITYLPYIMAVF